MGGLIPGYDKGIKNNGFLAGKSSQNEALSLMGANCFIYKTYLDHHASDFVQLTSRYHPCAVSGFKVLIDDTDAEGDKKDAAVYLEEQLGTTQNEGSIYFKFCSENSGKIFI
ncbi:hypothetical protein SAY87_013113 [Trapa incisa]|uniref:Uncharacterized protein n=1 Tax=Trapa incisa TaxID=236973 RepID=A0AAN7KIY7_9MYRT|nr:hypothetical protein SAY87_013113 [Trapa incisa]